MPLHECIMIFCIGISIITMIWAIIIYFNYYQAHKRLEEMKVKLLEMDNKYHELEKDRREKAIEYSQDLMKYLREFIAQITIIKFRSFVDNHDMKKISKANIEKLIQEIATTTNESLNKNNIGFDDIVFTKEFYDKYIIETAIILIKEMLEKYEEE